MGWGGGAGRGRTAWAAVAAAADAELRAVDPEGEERAGSPRAWASLGFAGLAAPQRLRWPVWRRAPRGSRATPRPVPQPSAPLVPLHPRWRWSAALTRRLVESEGPSEPAGVRPRLASPWERLTAVWLAPTCFFPAAVLVPYGFGFGFPGWILKDPYSLFSLGFFLILGTLNCCRSRIRVVSLSQLLKCLRCQDCYYLLRLS